MAVAATKEQAMDPKLHSLPTDVADSAAAPAPNRDPTVQDLRLADQAQKRQKVLHP